MSSAKQVVAKTPEQQVGIRNTIIWLLGFIALLLGLFLANFLTPRSLSDEALQELGYYRFPTAKTITEFSLTNHLGQAVGLKALKGNWSLLFFGFTLCPDICPTTLGVLKRAVTEMQPKPQVVMVSVDPERDTPEQLAHYVPSFHRQFVGYTGEFEQIVGLATQLNVAFGKVPSKVPGTYTVDHTASIVVIDPEGRYAGFIKAPHQAQNITRILNSLMR